MNSSPLHHVTTTETPEGQFWVRLVGDIDLAQHPALEAVVASARSGSPRDIVVDLTAATFIDCSVLTMVDGLVEVAQNVGGEVRVVGASLFLRRVLDLGGVTTQVVLDPMSRARH